MVSKCLRSRLSFLVYYVPTSRFLQNNVIISQGDSTSFHKHKTCQSESVPTVALFAPRVAMHVIAILLPKTGLIVV